MRPSRVEIRRCSPASTARSVLRTGPPTSTDPSFMSISNVSVTGSQLASKLVPVMRTSNGPARRPQRVSGPVWETEAVTEPRSSSTSAPCAVVSVTRMRAPGAAFNVEPSENRMGTSFSCSAAIQTPTSPRCGGSPTANEIAAPRERRTKRTATARHAAAAGRDERRDERRAPASRPHPFDEAPARVEQHRGIRGRVGHVRHGAAEPFEGRLHVVHRPPLSSQPRSASSRAAARVNLASARTSRRLMVASETLHTAASWASSCRRCNGARRRPARPRA